MLEFVISKLPERIRRNAYHFSNLFILWFAKLFSPDKCAQKIRIVLFDFRFAGNLRALYQKARDLNLPIEFGFMPVELADLKSLRKKPMDGIRLIDRLSFRDAKWVLQADFVVTSILIRRYMSLFRKINNRIKFVQTFHAIHLLGEPDWWFHEMGNFDKIFASSEEVIQKWFVKNGAPLEKFSATGYAGLDDLAKPKLTRAEIAQRTNLNPERKIILLAPTWSRASNELGGQHFNIFDQTVLKALDKLAKEKNVQIVFRTHPHEEIDHTLFDGLESVYLRGAKDYPKANEQLSMADIMVTDLSGIGAYFMATGKPMIFIKVDYKNPEFIRLLQDHELPGMQISSLQELLETLEVVLDRPEDYQERYRENAKYVKDYLFGTCFDGKAAERYLVELYKLLQIERQNQFSDFLKITTSKKAA